MRPAMIPKNTNTRLKPRIKKTAFLKVFSFSALPLPLTKAKKLGTRGNVHGIKKLASPAIKAGIIKLKSIYNQINNDKYIIK